MDYIAVNGEYRLLSMFDRYMCDDRDSARNYANISMAPSRAIDNYLETMNDRVITMFKDLGFTDGLLFMQGHTRGDKIVFYEMGCRLGGSFYIIDQACIGMNPVDMIIRYALTGKMVNDIGSIDKNIAKFPKYGFSYNPLLGGTDEIIADIIGLDEARQLPSYIGEVQLRDVGTHYKRDSIVDKPLTSIYLATDDFEQAKKDIRFINEHVEVYNEKKEPLLMKRYDPDYL